MEPQSWGYVQRAQQPQWLRGEARYDRGWLSLDRATTEEYQPFQESGLLFDLAAVREPQDAIAFVRRYGLLRHGPDDADLREPFSQWQADATTLAGMLAMTRAVRASAAGDEDASAELWQVWEPGLRRAFQAPAADDDELRQQASVAVAWLVSEGLKGAEERLEADVQWGYGPEEGGGDPGQFHLSIHPPSLLALIYHQLAMLLTGRVPLGTCEECGRFYAMDDPRKRFCSPTCASRSRRRRWRERQDGGSRPGPAEPETRKASTSGRTVGG